MINIVKPTDVVSGNQRPGAVNQYQNTSSRPNNNNELYQKPAEGLNPGPERDYDNLSEEKNIKKISEAIKKANEAVHIFNPTLHFSVHKETGRVMVQVIDSEENKVIREIPPEKILDMVAKIKEMVGLLVDEVR